MYYQNYAYFWWTCHRSCLNYVSLHTFKVHFFIFSFDVWICPGNWREVHVKLHRMFSKLELLLWAWFWRAYKMPIACRCHEEIIGE